MEFSQIDVNMRTGRGKEHSHKIRAAGRIPGIIYGMGSAPVSIDLEPRVLHKALQGPHRTNTVLNIRVAHDGKTDEMLVMVQDWQIHPRDRQLLHVDFLKVDLDREVQVEVPLETTGKSKGLNMGGVLIQVFHKLPVTCKPADIPVKISIDITELEIGDSLKASNLPVSEGVMVNVDPEQTILAVTTPAAEEKPSVVEGEGEAAEGEAAEGEAAEGEDKAKVKDKDKDKDKDKKDKKEKE